MQIFFEIKNFIAAKKKIPTFSFAMQRKIAFPPNKKHKKAEAITPPEKTLPKSIYQKENDVFFVINAKPNSKMSKITGSFFFKNFFVKFSLQK